MHTMKLEAAAKMRKSAAVVGEVIGKYHPHGDQAAYDALVRMAQDFSLRYPLIQGSGNFGSVDGDSAAAMRYTEARLSAFASTLMAEIDQGTTEMRPTYDAVGDEPVVLPAMMPNLLLNGSSGIAVGMSCSFPPHNLNEVADACRAMIKDPDIGNNALASHIVGPDFPTGGEIIDSPEALAEVYRAGHGFVRVRGTFEIEEKKRGLKDLIVTSIPYSVNKSRLIERIAQLVRDKRLKHIHDVRDESTEDIRIVLELRGTGIAPESVMAFLYHHTELQINFPINFIAVNPDAVPVRLSLKQILAHFLDFRYSRTVLRLEHRLAALKKRIHILEGFSALFRDIDTAIAIIRSARSRKEAADGLKQEFGLDDEQVDAILEMRLYRLVALEMGKLMDELAEKQREASSIEKDLASPKRIWGIIDKELVRTAKQFGDARRTHLVEEQEAPAVEYDPDAFVDHEDTTVILSKQGWVRRVKMEVEDPGQLKFREGDALMATARVNTEKTVAFCSNMGKLYVMRALDVPATTGFGEPVSSVFALADGEYIVGFLVPDPAAESADAGGAISEPSEDGASGGQLGLFSNIEIGDDKVSTERDSVDRVIRQAADSAIVVTASGKGFRFGPDILREPTKRTGRKLVTLKKGDTVVTAKPVYAPFAVAASDTGKVLLFPVDQVPLLSGPAQGVRIMKLTENARVVSLEPVDMTDVITIDPKRGKPKTIRVSEIPQANRDTQGKVSFGPIKSIEKVPETQRPPE